MRFSLRGSKVQGSRKLILKASELRIWLYTLSNGSERIYNVFVRTMEEIRLTAREKIRYILYILVTVTITMTMVTMVMTMVIAMVLTMVIAMVLTMVIAMVLTMVIAMTIVVVLMMPMRLVRW